MSERALEMLRSKETFTREEAADLCRRFKCAEPDKSSDTEGAQLFTREQLTEYLKSASVIRTRVCN